MYSYLMEYLGFLVSACERVIGRQTDSQDRKSDRATGVLTGGDARWEVEELLQELAEAELGRQVIETAGVAGGRRSEVIPMDTITTAITAARQEISTHTHFTHSFSWSCWLPGRGG